MMKIMEFKIWIILLKYCEKKLIKLKQYQQNYDSRIKGHVVQEDAMFELLTRKGVKLTIVASYIKCHSTKRNVSRDNTPTKNVRSFVKSLLKC